MRWRCKGDRPGFFGDKPSQHDFDCIYAVINRVPKLEEEAPWESERCYSVCEDCGRPAYLRGAPKRCLICLGEKRRLE